MPVAITIFLFILQNGFEMQNCRKQGNHEQNKYRKSFLMDYNYDKQKDALQIDLYALI